MNFARLFFILSFMLLGFVYQVNAGMLIQQTSYLSGSNLGYDGGAGGIAAQSYITIEPGGGGASFAYCQNVGVVDPPATSAGNCRLATNANLLITYMSTSKIRAILPAGYGNKTITLEYFDEGDNYWYFYNSQSLTITDLAPKWLNYTVSPNIYLFGLLYARTDNPNYFYYKNFDNPVTSLGFSVSYNSGSTFLSGSSQVYPTIAVMYYTGGNSNSQFLINGTVNTSRITYHGASGITGVRQVNFDFSGLGSNPNFKIRNTDSVNTGGCGVGCEESFAMQVDTYQQ